MLVINRNPEARLVETLAEIRDECETWSAVVFHLHLLADQYRSEYQLKIALNLAHDLLSSSEGRIFSFPDGAVAVLCNNITGVLTNKLIFQLRYLCMDDPLAYNEDGYENPDFCTIFRLGADWQKCMNFATRRMTTTARGEKSEGTPENRVKGHLPFSASRLATIERDLAQLDLTPALRRQPVCALVPGGPIKRVFDELYINMMHLRQLLKVDVDFLSNKWLFKSLTQLLDERVMALVKNDSARQLAQPVSININLEALLTDWFAEFDAALAPSQKVAVVFEVPVVDVFADMAAYNYARESVQRLGYRICIDGLTTQSFLHIDRDRLRADLVKLQWNADVAADLTTPENAMLHTAIEKCGANRVILCRCDNKQAVDYGLALKLSLFQGRYLDSFINPQATQSN